MIALRLGDVVPLAGGSWVVGTVTADAAGVAYAWQLFLVPAGKLPGDLGKTWTRSETETAYMNQPTTLSTTTDFDAPPRRPRAPERSEIGRNGASGAAPWGGPADKSLKQ